MLASKLECAKLVRAFEGMPFAPQFESQTKLTYKPV